MSDAKQRITTFLTFNGNAEAAMNFYASVFPGARILDVTPIGEAGPGEKEKPLVGTFELLGQRFMVMNMQGAQAPAFSWATSLYVDCADEREFDDYFASLSREGTVMMGPEPVLNLRKVAWVTDKFGLTWQLVWA